MSVFHPAPIAQPTPFRVDGQKQNLAPGSIGETLSMINSQSPFGPHFAHGSGHSMLAHGGLPTVYGVYHMEVMEAMRKDGWRLISGAALAPPRDADLETWGEALVRTVALELLDANGLSSVLGNRIAAGDELTAVITGSDGSFIGSNLASLARGCAARTSAEGERAYYAPLFFGKGMVWTRNECVELPELYTEERWALTEGISLGYYAAPYPLGKDEHQDALRVLAAAFKVSVRELRVEHLSTSRKGAQGVRVTIAHAFGLTNAAARDFANLEKMFLTRGHAQTTTCRREAATHAGFEALAHAHESRRASGGLVQHCQWYWSSCP